jgi:hypothetical protein
MQKSRQWDKRKRGEVTRPTITEHIIIINKNNVAVEPDDLRKDF